MLQHRCWVRSSQGASCFVLSNTHLLPKVLIPGKRWLHPDMTVKLFSVTLNIIANKYSCQSKKKKKKTRFVTFLYNLTFKYTFNVLSNVVLLFRVSQFQQNQMIIYCKLEIKLSKSSWATEQIKLKLEIF